MVRPFVVGLQCRICKQRFERRRPWNGPVPSICYNPECRAENKRRVDKLYRERMARGGR